MRAGRTGAWPAGRAAPAAVTLALAGSLLAGAAPAQPAASAATAGAGEAAWPVVGRQGIVRLVVVPAGQERDRAAYQRQIAQLCPPDQTCFVNFYANPSGATVETPLPDAISREATLIFRRSLKQGAELYSWACRLQMDDSGPCF